jgi:hypothetical protein
VGRARRDPDLPPAARVLSDVRHPDGTDRLCRSAGAHHAPAASGDWARLPIDAYVARGGTARGELEQSAAHAFLADWDRTRPTRRPRHLGADEIHRGKGQKFYTVLSDLVQAEVIGLAKDRTEESLAGLLTTSLDARQRAAVRQSAPTCIAPI